ncbi:hypothetical protein [Paracidovorax sp. MALMAid1276]|uniref:hypothetical protein n=1 Tax=Paracidovorax sp. MALMAid1276 TaxID=3411631 RepID=UPI003B991F9A
MAHSSLLGIDADPLAHLHSATGNDSLGPSDASDSGSDSAGLYGTDPDNDTDRHGTGERASVEPGIRVESRDILPDHLESMDSDSDEPGDAPRVHAGADDYPGDDPADETPGSADADEGDTGDDGKVA